MAEYKILDVNVGEAIMLPEHIVIKEEVILPETETEEEYDNDPQTPEFQLELIKEENLQNSFETDDEDPLAFENNPDFLKINSCFVSLHRGIDIEEMLSCKICKNLQEDHKWRCSFIEESLKYKYGFYCQECNKKMVTQQQYIQHMSSAHNIKKSHECNICNEGLKRLIALNAHTCAKNKNRTYKCLDCSQMLQQQISLKFHLFIHAHNKPLGYHLKKKEEMLKLIECEKCKRKFPSQWHLKRHWATFHSTQKYYQCFICQGTFKLKNLLQIHLQTHIKINKTDNITLSNDLNIQGSQNGLDKMLENNMEPDGGNFKIEWQESEVNDVPYYQSEFLEMNEPTIENTYPDSDSNDNIPLAKLNEN